MLTFKINPQRFEIFKEKVCITSYVIFYYVIINYILIYLQRVTHLKNIAMEQPYEIALRYNYIITSENDWTIDELLTTIDGKFLYFKILTFSLLFICIFCNFL